MRRVLSGRAMLSSVVAAALAVGLAAAPASAAPVAAPAAAVAVAPAVAAPAAAPAGVLSGIAPGLRGFDTLGVETPAQINCLSAAGYSYDFVDVIGTAWKDEYDAAAAAGLKVVLFQGYDPTTWADPSQGSARGAIVAAKAAAAGYPAGAQIFLNFEDNIQAGTSVGELKTWVANWVGAVRSKGYQAGLYVGVPQLLQPADIDSIPNVLFWRSASRSAPAAGRGYVASQTAIGSGACGIAQGIDIDIAGRDARGAGLVGAAFPQPFPVPTVPGAFAPLSPARIVDTRNGTGATGPVAGGRTVDIQVTGRGGVPVSGAAAVVLTVTATGPTGSGYLSVFPAGAARPQVSSLNFVAAQTVANLVTVRLGTGGRVSLFNGAAGTVQILADVAGYYLAGTATRPGTFTPIVPARLLDTRPTGVAGLSRTTVGTAARSPIPAGGYDATVLNVTAVAPSSAGFLTAYAADLAAPPTASNLNFPAGRTAPNMATVPVDAAGRVALYNGSRGRTDLLADVAGYYRSGTRTDRGAFTPRTPVRILDTRPSGKVPGGSAIALRVTGMPAGSSAAVLDVTVVRATAAGYLTVYPSDRSTPQASNVNFVAGVDIADQVIVPIGADGRVVLLNSSAGATDLIVDLAGSIRG